jgi:hypothetical protein
MVIGFLGRMTGLGILILGLAACAGPMSPFGSLDLQQKTAKDDGKLSEKGQTARVRFSPERQVLHTSSPFSVIIEDPEGVPEDFHLVVNFNGMDVTRAFMAHAQMQNLDPLNHEVRLTTKYLRLLPNRENSVKVTYYRSVKDKTAAAQYMPPSCSAFATDRMLLSVPEFDPPMMVLQLINQDATKKNLNPFFVAALVAQESSFDPQAMSHSRALGLTQVTPLGEAEILKSIAGWPRYPGIDTLPLPLVRLGILSGRISAGNEWRLDPARSIEGGIEYLSYLSDYWNRPDKRAEIQRKLGPGENALSEVMLASYNSGATRVGDALERDGQKWLQDEELKEARKYVRRVVSYCDHFENRED